MRYAQHASSEKSVRLDDAFQNDLDQWMGGGTCFSITWHLYQELRALDYEPKLLMGHQKGKRNIHCALSLDFEGKTLFFDPGYLIFDPLTVPPASHEVTEQNFALIPNWVKLRRQQELLELWTGSPGQTLRFRFYFDLAGVREKEFFVYWIASFYFEMMQYPVLNRLDREKGVQYYFQKDKLITRSAQGSQVEKISKAEQKHRIAKIFHLDPQLIADAFATLKL